MFNAFSRHLHCANSWNKQGQPKRVHFETKKQQVTATLNHVNNIELQELNYHPMLRSSKDSQLSINIYKHLNE
jgi:hypothetical protein